MPSPILARADALMQRRHQNSLEQSDLPVLTDAIDDDYPVLRDVAPLTETPSASEIITDPAPVTMFSRPNLLDSGIRDILAHELARRVEQRLIAELPRLIESIVHDFLTEQEMMAAPQPRD